MPERQYYTKSQELGFLALADHRPTQRRPGFFNIVYHVRLGQKLDLETDKIRILFKRHPEELEDCVVSSLPDTCRSLRRLLLWFDSELS